MYYICDLRKPNEPFLFFDEIDGKVVPATYADASEAEKICNKMNRTSTLTQFAVKVRT